MGDFLAQHGLTTEEIDHWAVHPGGIKIIDYVEQSLELDEGKLDHSRHILRQYGNMSSASLLFVLEHLIEQDKPQAGQYGVLMGFGSGLTVEFVLVQW